MRRQSLAKLAIGLSIIVLGNTQALAFDRCDCRHRAHGHYAPGAYGYYYRLPLYFRGPRWDYAAAYYNPPVYDYVTRRRFYGRR